MRTRAAAIALGVLPACCAPVFAQASLYPDIIVRQSDLYDNDIWLSSGRRWLRLSNGTANIGDGKLYLYGVFPPNDDGTQISVGRGRLKLQLPSWFATKSCRGPTNRGDALAVRAS